MMKDEASSKKEVVVKVGLETLLPELREVVLSKSTLLFTFLKESSP